MLVLDAYDRAGREALGAAGATPAGELYARVLGELEPGLETPLAFAAEADPGLPAGASLSDFDGAVFTGSSLTIHREGDPHVRRQVELARALLDAGVPCFGSCWAAQLAAVAAGGHCGPCERGREFGLARDIALTPTGVSHPLFAGRSAVFDALASHADEVKSLPPGAAVLATNAFSRVQALAVDRGSASFWAVQWHPEYDLHEVARLAVLRAEELVGQGLFGSRGELDAWVAELEALHRDPRAGPRAAQLGVGPELLGARERGREIRRWLDVQVKAPRAPR